MFSREAAPELWGQLQNNLAIVYWSRIHGDRGENVEEAIGGFDSALTVITREKDPTAGRRHRTISPTPRHAAAR